MEVYKPPNFKKIYVPGDPAGWKFVHTFGLYPSFEMAITPSFCEQIEKFQCLSSSTAQGLSRDTWHTHLARVHVPENVSWSLWTLRLNFFEIPPAKDFKITWNHLSRHVRVDIYHKNHCTIFFVVNHQFWHCADLTKLCKHLKCLCYKINEFAVIFCMNTQH